MKKLLSILLLCGLIVTSAACSSDTADTSDTSANAVDTTVADVETTADDRPDLPKEDFGGYEFRSLSRGRYNGNTHWSIFEFEYLEEKAGDTVNEAVFERNTYIEDTYNVKIKMIDKGSSGNKNEPLEAARTAVLANSDDFDIYGDSVDTASQLAAEGLLIELSDLNYTDLSQPYYDQESIKQLSIADKLYTVISDMNLLDKHGTWITLFNKSTITEYNLENPYELVKSGSFTMDKMLDMMKKVSHDVDGDGVMTEYDSVGMFGETWNINALMMGADVLTFEKNDNDIPEFALENERTYTAFEKAYAILFDKSVSLFDSDIKGSYTDLYTEPYITGCAENRMLFYVTGMNRVILFRGMESDFGVLPNPKLDETQEKYRVVQATDQSSSISVPVTNSDLDRTSILIEALSYESSVTTLPAYIETTIKGKHARDEESIEMIELIFDNRVFDLGLVFDWGGSRNFYTTLGKSGSTNVASELEKNKEAYVAKMLETVELFTK